MLRGAVENFDWQQPRPSTASWLASYQAGAWPEPRLEVKPSGSPSLDTELSRLAGIWAAVVRAVRERSSRREELQATAYASDETTPARELWLLESDYFLLALASAISAAADRAERTADADSLAAEIHQFLEEHPFRGQDSQGLVQRLLDILDLPIWELRHELYSAWVLVAILEASPGCSWVCSGDPWVLSFPFRPTPMAELLDCDTEMTVWSELRSPLSDPIGSSRKRGIQPDYSIVRGKRGQSPDPTQSQLEVECKQYLQANSKGFAAALRDYAKGRPNSLVLLVSNGPLQPRPGAQQGPGGASGPH